MARLGQPPTPSAVRSHRARAQAPPTRAAPPAAWDVASLQRLAGNHAVSRVLAGVTVQRLVAKDVMWEHYHEAYQSRMRIKKDYQIDQRWTGLFLHFERQLYAAKEGANVNGDVAYDAVPVQDAHDNLAAMGFDAPPPAADPNVSVARALVTAANARWAAFRNNRRLNRGAWAGSQTHGARPADYVQTTPAVLAVLTAMQVAQGGRLGNWWLMASDTSPSGHSLHRGAIDARGDFIYHL